MSRLCITTTVNQDYQEFIPWFIYFLAESYPEYSVRVFLEGKMSKSVATCMRLLDQRYSVDYAVVEGCFKNAATDNFGIKSQRWFNRTQEFENFDYLYIGDIDILVCRESPALLEQHIDHCKLLGLPYSNSLRPKGERLTGLHFVHREKWYAAMGEVLKRYEQDLASGKLSDKDFELGNEQLLYRMVQESSLDLPQSWQENSCKDYHFRPHHGFHLRVWYSSERRCPQDLLKTEQGKQVTEPVFKSYCEQLIQMSSSDTFRFLFANLSMPQQMIARMFEFYEHLGWVKSPPLRSESLIVGFKDKARRCLEFVRDWPPGRTTLREASLPKLILLLVILIPKEIIFWFLSLKRRASAGKITSLSDWTSLEKKGAARRVFSDGQLFYYWRKPPPEFFRRELDSERLEKAYKSAEKGKLGELHNVICHYLKAGMRVLDVGCSTGARMLALRVNQLQVDGVESDSETVEAVHKIRPDLSISNGSITNLTAADQSYEAYLSFDLINRHHDDIGAMFKEAHRVLVPDGLALISFNHCSSLRRLKSYIGCYRNSQNDDGMAVYKRAFPASQVSDLLEEIGFSVIAAHHHDALRGLSEEVFFMNDISKHNKYGRSFRDWIRASSIVNQIAGNSILLVCRKVMTTDC